MFINIYDSAGNFVNLPFQVRAGDWLEFEVSFDNAASNRLWWEWHNRDSGKEYNMELAGVGQHQRIRRTFASNDLGFWDVGLWEFDTGESGNVSGRVVAASAAPAPTPGGGRLDIPPPMPPRVPPPIYVPPPVVIPPAPLVCPTGFHVSGSVCVADAPTRTIPPISTNPPDPLDPPSSVSDCPAGWSPVQCWDGSWRCASPAGIYSCPWDPNLNIPIPPRIDPPANPLDPGDGNGGGGNGGGGGDGAGGGDDSAAPGSDFFTKNLTIAGQEIPMWVVVAGAALFLLKGR